MSLLQLRHWSATESTLEPHALACWTCDRTGRNLGWGGVGWGGVGWGGVGWGGVGGVGGLGSPKPKTYIGIYGV